LIPAPSETFFLKALHGPAVFPVADAPADNRVVKGPVSRKILGHEAQAEIGPIGGGKMGQDSPGPRLPAGKDKVTYYQSPDREPPGRRLEMSHLTVHGHDGPPVVGHVVRGPRITSGGSGVGVFHVRQENVDDPLQGGEGGWTFVAVGVVDHRQGQAVLSGQDHG